MSLNIADTVQSVFLQQQPIKQSGYGREIGHAMLDAYTQVKTVWVNLR